MKITVTMDTREIDRALRSLAAKQVPFATSLGLNLTAKDVLTENKKYMDRVFDRPTRWTKNAFYVDRSTKTKLKATVERKSAVGRQFYLEVQSKGGPRKRTAMESLFRRRLPYEGDIQSVLPGSKIRRNRFGNISPGQMQKILSGVKVQRDKAQNSTGASIARRGSKRARYFVPSTGSKLKPGVWTASGKRGKPRMLLAFSNSVQRYRPIFKFEDHGRKTAQRVMLKNFKQAVDRAMATARR